MESCCFGHEIKDIREEIYIKWLMVEDLKLEIMNKVKFWSEWVKICKKLSEKIRGIKIRL